MHPDNPERDNTPDAHPAWWRGNHAGALGLGKVLKKVIDGIPPADILRDSTLHELRKRIWKLVQVDNALGPYRLVVSGGRSYALTGDDKAKLGLLVRRLMTTVTIVTGDASGADDEAARWAAGEGLQVMKIPANWTKEGRGAGPLRNKRMAQLAHGVALFPGGSGTNSMRTAARNESLPIFEMTEDPDAWPAPRF